MLLLHTLYVLTSVSLGGTIKTIVISIDQIFPGVALNRVVLYTGGVLKSG